MLPKHIQDFIEVFSKLPLVGPRMAHRLAFHLLNLDKQTFKNIETALSGLKNINRCPKCFFIKDAEDKLCRICSNNKRNKKQITVVEKETSLISIEKSGAFNGTYFILGESNTRGKLQTKQKLRLNHLKKLIKKEFGEKIEEIIIAVNPTTEGDFLTQKISEELKGITKKITRLGRGIPTGGEIEFADQETLSNAFQNRKQK